MNKILSDKNAAIKFIRDFSEGGVLSEAADDAEVSNDLHSQSADGGGIALFTLEISSTHNHQVLLINTAVTK